MSAAFAPFTGVQFTPLAPAADPARVNALYIALKAEHDLACGAVDKLEAESARLWAARLWSARLWSARPTGAPSANP